MRNIVIDSCIKCECCGETIGISHEQDFENGDGSYSEYNSLWCGLGGVNQCHDCHDSEILCEGCGDVIATRYKNKRGLIELKWLSNACGKKDASGEMMRYCKACEESFDD